MSNQESVQFLLGRPECISSFSERFTPLYVHSFLHLAEVAGRRVAARAVAAVPPPPQSDDGSSEDVRGPEDDSSEGVEHGADDHYAVAVPRGPYAGASDPPIGDEGEGDPGRQFKLINDRRLYELRGGARACEPLGPWRSEPPATLKNFCLYLCRHVNLRM